MRSESSCLQPGSAPWWLFGSIALLCAAACAPFAPSDGADPSSADDDAGLEVASTVQPLWFWEEDCVLKTFNGTQYYICTGLNTWDLAKARCAKAGMKLVKVDSPEENTFIQANVKFANWTGGRVPVAGADQTWTWDLDGSAICKSGWLGCAAINGAYNNWFPGEPLNQLTCLYQEAFTKQWHAGACGVTLGFVCENPDSCVNDPRKLSPGVCGCGRADVDTDADGAMDCVDECPADKLKKEAGQCGCAVADTDSDADGVPDCADRCPTTKGLYFPGTCGCGSAVAPAGTACRDGISPTSTDTCNGSGVCGNPASGKPGKNDTAVTCDQPRFRDGNGYWFCKGATSWTAADSYCREQAGRQLVAIDSRAEAAFIKANSTGWSWIGANDRTTDGQWRWTASTSQNGPLFWQGAADPAGKRTPSGYSKWASGQPVAGAAACGRVGTAGTWDAQACTQGGNGFICEVPTGEGVPPKSDGKPGPGAPLPFDPLCKRAGFRCLLNPGQVRPCVKPEVAFGDYYKRDPNTKALLVDADGNFIPDPDAFYAAAQACESCLAGKTQAKSGECSALCKGPMAEPPAGTTCTETFNIDPAERSACRIVTADMVPVPGWSFTLPKFCSTNADCDTANGKVCGVYQWFGAANDPSAYNCTREDKSWLSTKGDNCENQASATSARNYKVCGLPVKGCPDGRPDIKCKTEPEVCASEYSLYTADKVSPFGTVLKPTSMANEPWSVRSSAPASAASYAAGGPKGKDACANAAVDCPAPTNGVSRTHAWCNYQLADDETVPKQGQDKPKTGKSGSGSLVEFDLSPKIKLEFKAMKDVTKTDGSIITKGEDRLPGAFGYLDYSLNARAEFVAQATFNLTKALRGKLEVVELIAQVKADKCGASSGDTAFKLFGKDYIAQVTNGLITPDKPFTFPGTPEKQAACNKTFDKFNIAVNRAKKAYRDAQELLTQYKTNEALGKNFANLCTTLAANAPARFPKVNEFDAALTCATESPEATINRFIMHYTNEVAAIGKSVQTGMENIGSEVVPGNIKPPSFLEASKTLYSYGPVDTEETLFTSTFLVGPIPVNLEVLSLLHYGVNVGFTARLDPWALVAEALNPTSDMNKVKIGQLTLNGTPYVGVGVALFVGVGFDCGVAAAKAGAEGQLSLGEVSLPVYAGIALHMSQSKDPRTTAPNDLAPLRNPFADDRPAIPMRNYNLSFGYMFGADLHLGNIMSGIVSAKVKIKFFWFSKTWRATLFQFDGLCPGKGPEGKFEPEPGNRFTEELPCHFQLFTGEGAISMSKTPADWATISMPVPFYELSQLFITRPTGATPAVFSQAKSKELFYDSLCSCIDSPAEEAKDDILDANGKLVGPADPLCTRNDDCCSTVPTCFSNPENSGKNECSSCRKVTTAESCNTNTDCCGYTPAGTTVLGCWDQPDDASTVKHCVNKRALNQSCNVTNDCQSTLTLGCWDTPYDSSAIKTCVNKRANYATCNATTDCASAPALGCWMSHPVVNGQFAERKICSPLRKQGEECRATSECAKAPAGARESCEYSHANALLKTCQHVVIII